MKAVLAAPVNNAFDNKAVLCYISQTVCYIVPAYSWEEFLTITGFINVDYRNPFTDHIRSVYNNKIMVNDEIYYFLKIM